MQNHTIEELYGMLDAALNKDNPGTARLSSPPESQARTISISVSGASVAYTFYLADEDGFIAAPGEHVSWQDASKDDLKRSVEYMVDWIKINKGDL